jgi:hypothetical protein
MKPSDSGIFIGEISLRMLLYPITWNYNFMALAHKQNLLPEHTTRIQFFNIPFGVRIIWDKESTVVPAIQEYYAKVLFYFLYICRPDIIRVIKSGLKRWT